MKNKKASRKERTRYLCIKTGLLLLIILYPLISSFFGIDLGDSGIHYYGYSHLFSTPEQLSFTAYFSMLIGWVWLRIFPFLGLWGLNLLEAILEIAIAIVAYRMLKNRLGDLTTLVGLLIAMMAMGTYLNVFNHHQLNVLLLVAIMACQYRAVTTEKKKYSFMAGIFFALVVASRMGSVTAIVTFAIYFVWWLLEKKRFKDVLKHAGYGALGAFSMAAVVFAVMAILGHVSYFAGNIGRLFGLASGSNGGSGGYGFKDLLKGFIKGNVYAITSGAIVYAAFFIILVAVAIIMKAAPKGDRGRTIMVGFLSLIMIVIAGCLLKFAYDVYPAPDWPQMTSGPSYTIGVLYFSAFLCMAYNLFHEDGKNELVYISIFSFMLPLLTIAGANTGTKHVVLAFWFIAPLTVYVVKRLWKSDLVRKYALIAGEEFDSKKSRWPARIAIILVGASFFYKYGDMLYHTNNFDSIHRNEITASVNSEKLKYLKTTQREADSLNGIIDEVDCVEDKENRKLMVYGGSILLYTLLDMDAYVQPWFTNGVYNNDTLVEDLEKRLDDENEPLPVVIFCRTNNYYGFYEEKYEALVEAQMKTTYSGKRDIFLSFLSDNNYHLGYYNDYYCVFYPEDIDRYEEGDYLSFIKK